MEMLQQVLIAPRQITFQNVPEKNVCIKNQHNYSISLECS